MTASTVKPIARRAGETAQSENCLQVTVSVAPKEWELYHQWRHTEMFPKGGKVISVQQ